MPHYETFLEPFELSRDAVIVDTNVFVAAFVSDESLHIEAQYFLNEFPHQWLVPAAVVVETWGFIVGKKRNWQAGYSFLAWLTTPGKNVILLPQHSSLLEERELIESLQIDCVDAIIAKIATMITVVCALEASLPIATFDTRDFFRFAGRQDVRLRVYDVKELLVQETEY